MNIILNEFFLKSVNENTDVRKMYEIVLIHFLKMLC